MSDCENRHSSSPSRHSREGGNPQAFTAKYAEERRVKTLTTEAQRHRGLPEGWCNILLGDVIILSKKKVDPKLCPELRYLSLEHISSNSNEIIGSGTARDVRSTKSVFQAGDLLYGKLRPYLNKVCIPDFDGVCSTDIFVFKQSKLMLRGYLLRQLTAKNFVDFASMKSKGINLPRLGISEMSSYPILLPPLNEQKRIVAKIEALQARSKAARDALAAVPNLVEQFKQSVLAAAFRGDLSKTWREQHPDVEPAEQLLARIRTERRTKWEADQLAAYEAKNKTPPKNWQSRYKEPVSIDTSNLPDLPESWCWASLGEATVKVQDGNYGGSYPKKNEWTETGVPFLTPAAIREDGAIDDSLVKHVSVEKNAKLTKAQLKKGDIIFPNRGSREAQVNGKQPFAIQVPSFYSDGNINPQLTLVRLMPKLLSPLYVCLAMNAPVFLQEIRSLTRGGALRFINLTQSCKLPIPIISLEEQHQITQRIESLFAYADSILEQAKASLAELDQLDQSILAKAFRGELVPQDPNDEPASVLLERIKAERAKVTPVKKSRKKAMA